MFQFSLFQRVNLSLKREKSKLLSSNVETEKGVETHKDVEVQATVEKADAWCGTDVKFASKSTMTSRSTLHNSITSQVLKSDKKCISLCGVPRNLLKQTFKTLEGHFLESRTLTHLDQLVMYFYILKWAQPFTVVGPIFGISDPDTVSKYFGHILDQHFNLVKDKIGWLTKEETKETMPPSFKMYYPNTRIIIDASEVRIQKPSSVKAAILTYSQYKSAHTLKFLITIAPNGLIVHISRAYGGRITDGQLTILSGILDKLEDGDEGNKSNLVLLAHLEA